MSDLSARKKLLIAESEVYRETLKLEIQNVKIYAVRAKRRLASPAAYAPWLIAAFPIARTFMAGKKRRSIAGKLVRSAFIGWQTFRRFAPVLRNLFPQRKMERAATEEFLDKMI